ncbi:hypothetical protein E2L07_11285 [Halalkalibacterium halodurans]|uniref:hypothetical protein n=1 Tax=Halalkalibacterium halodurans TaxID=86665 RepID=UPI0010683EDA|nr:hypothetical protein [Halalkalibacterium halodurans]TES53897.1 hypothetical protein E2L07_11285 [Halalkalibacterium halodurans]
MKFVFNFRIAKGGVVITLNEQSIIVTGAAKSAVAWIDEKLCDDLRPHGLEDETLHLIASPLLPEKVADTVVVCCQIRRSTIQETHLIKKASCLIL